MLSDEATSFIPRIQRAGSRSSWGGKSICCVPAVCRFRVRECYGQLQRKRKTPPRSAGAVGSSSKIAGEGSIDAADNSGVASD